jgi:cytochrome c
MQHPSRIALRMAAVLLAIVPLVAHAAANELRYADRLTPLLDSAGGHEIGIVSPAAPLVVKSESNGYVEVAITGWSPAGGDRYLFKDVGLRITEAVLDEEGLKNRTGGASKEDDYGSDWQNATFTGWIAGGDVTDSLDKIWSAAGDIYFSHCTRCHSLRRPGDFTANQWPQALKVMTVRAGLTPAEAALVTALLQTHAKDQHVEDAFTAAAKQQPETVAAQAGLTVTPQLVARGGELFKSDNCFACHGDDAKTPAAPAYPKLAGQTVDYLYKQLLDFKSGLRLNDPDGVMKSAAEPLAEDDLKALAAWIAAQ